MLKFELDMFLTTLLGAVGVLIGTLIKRRSKFFDKIPISAAVIGGLLLSIVSLILFLTGAVELSFDDTIKNLSMTIFFTTIGFQASLKNIKKFGLDFAKLSIAIVLLMFVQNGISIGLSYAFKVNPLVGLTTGSMSMIGSHGTAQAFSKTLLELGVEGADSLSSASATFGVVCGALLGGPLAALTIRHKKLKTFNDVKGEIIEENQNEETKTKKEIHVLLYMFFLLKMLIWMES